MAMNSTQKLIWGLIIGFTGGLLLPFGVALTSTIIGGCIGLPMIAFGIPMMIWGAVWIFQAQFQKQQEVIERGVYEGIQRADSVKSDTDRGDA